MDAGTIGPYRVLGLIGRGGMGVVYAAEHMLLSRPAAIKVLLPELSVKQDLVVRFFNEARAATAIRHPGIVEIYDFGWTTDGAAYIVMEQLQGETLEQRSLRVRLHWSASLGIARQIARALSAAHAKGIIHRDLKPDNVFLVCDPEVPGGERIKLLDFGIAKLAPEPSPVKRGKVTDTGTVMGTPAYMSPEQCRGVGVDHRADLYALGCVLYELCCGRPPFVGEGSGDVLAAHIHVAVPPLSAVGAEIPAAAEQIIQRLLAKSPGDRFHTAEALIGAIDEILGEGSVATSGTARGSFPRLSPLGDTTLSRLVSPVLPRPPARRRRSSVATAIVSIAAIAAAVVTIAVRRGDHGAAAAAAPGTHRVAPPVVASPPVAQAPVPVPAQPEAAPPVDVTSVADGAAGPTAEPRGDAASHAQAAPHSVAVAIDSAPPGASVMLDGAELGTTPYRGRLARADRDRRLIVHLPGYADHVVVAAPGRAVRERIELAQMPVTAQKKPVQSRDSSVNPFD